MSNRSAAARAGKKTLNVGLIGYQFMGKAHSNAWLQAPHFFTDLPAVVNMHTIAGRNQQKVQETADLWGWKHASTDALGVIKDPEIDLVDVATPNNAHPEFVLAAAEAKKAIACEKPLARTLKEAREMVAAVKKAKVPNYVWFNYRRVPALAYARKLIASGRLGKIFHVRALYLQDWIVDPSFPWVWRLSKAVAGSGSHGDLGAHSIDMVRYLLGDEFTEVCGFAQTFVKERPVGEMTEGLSAKKSKSTGKTAKVDVDDAVLFLAKFKSGAIGTFEATRFATGHHNGNSVEINGEKGSIKFYFPDFTFLDFFDNQLPYSERGWRRISASTGEHDYAKNYWPADHVIGYGETFINTAADIIRDLAGQTKDFHANFEDGLRVQEVLEAVMLSDKEKGWVRIKDLP